MNVNKEDMLLYVVTDRSWLKNDKLENQVEEIVKSGATMIQLREKDLDCTDFALEGKKIKAITDKYKIPFIINDNIEVALAVNADGLHVGQSDMDAKGVRAMIGKDKILGVSAQTVEQALLAQQNGADYIGVGAVFSTSTKADADAVSFGALKAICDSVSIPVVAIGGINEKNAMQLKGSGIDGIAVISAIFAAPDKSEAAKKLLALAKEVIL